MSEFKAVCPASSRSCCKNGGEGSQGADREKGKAELAQGSHRMVSLFLTKCWGSRINFLGIEFLF